jgi:hypothetical protein
VPHDEFVARHNTWLKQGSSTREREVSARERGGRARAGRRDPRAGSPMREAQAAPRGGADAAQRRAEHQREVAESRGAAAPISPRARARRAPPARA